MMNHSRAQSGRSAVDERPDDRSTLDRDPAHGTATDEPPKGFLGLSIPQLLGGAFAAVSTAVVASFLGVAGTLIGAALGSIVSTVCAAVYTSMATNAQSHVRRVAVRPGRGSQGGATAADEAVGRGAANSSSGGSWTPSRSSGSIDVAAPASGGAASASGRRFDVAALRRSVRPRTLLAATAVVFALAIGLVTALEIGLGRPVSASETTGARSGTSLSQVVQDVSGRSAPSEPSVPADAPTPADIPTDGTTPGTEATPGQDSTGAPSDGATVNPEGSPTADPTAPADGSGNSTQPTDAPTQGGSGSDQGGSGGSGDQPANPTPQAPAPTQGGADAGSGQAG